MSLSPPSSPVEILDTLAQRRGKLRALGVTRLGLFGSAVRGELRPGSDLDFVVEFSEKSFDRYMAVKFLIEDTFLRPVDLVSIWTIKPALRARILSEVAYVQGL